MHHRTRTRIRRRLAGFAAVTLLLSTGALAGKVKMDSLPYEGELTINGALDDWGEGLFTIDGKQIAIGVRNDSTDLYIGFRTWDRGALLHGFANGIMLRVAPGGRKSEAFTLHFPVGAFDSGDVRPEPGQRPDREAIRSAFEVSANFCWIRMSVICSMNPL